MRWRLNWVLSALLIGMIFHGEQALAAEKASKKPSATKSVTQSASPAPPLGAPAAIGPTLPDGPRLRLLIYTTLIAINQANQTGNYSVLRDLAAPNFREANDIAKLAEIFGNLRRRNLDLSPVIFLEPKLVRPPAIMNNGMLRLSGFIPSAPEQVNFDLAYQFVGGHWLLFAIGVNTSRSAEAAMNSSPENTSANTSVEPAPQTATQKSGVKKR